MTAERGRPKTGKRLVPLIIMVPEEVKKGLVKQAREDGISVGQLMRIILNSMHGDYS